MDKATLNRLRYRRQFLFGPRAVALEGDWRTQPVGTQWVLTVHRDLPFRLAKAADGAQLLLLGFLIDPDFPELNDQQLFERLRQCRGWEELLQATLYLSGRWAIFHVSEQRVRVVNDATALRGIYFSVAGQEPWCFSQPGLYRFVQPVEYSRESVEFIRSKECQKDFEAVWPATSSPYDEVAHLLPNHYLDLGAHTTTRFYPTEPLAALSMEAALPEAARILQQSMRAITARGSVAFALTAGRDSRTLFAASRAVADRIWVHTGVYGELNAASPDLRISAALCGVAGLTHHVLPCPKRLSEPFKRIYMSNNDPAHVVWARICEGLLAGFPADTISVRGNVAETIRCGYYRDGNYPAALGTADLIRVSKLPPSQFVQRHFDAWFAEASPMEKLGYKTLDLFHWENRIANWLSVSQTEYDIVHDTFSPYSNRKLLATMLGTPIAARSKPDYPLYRELIRTMWPELLPFPINPRAKRTARLLHKARKARLQISALVGWRPVQVRLQWHGPKSIAGSTLASRNLAS
jgi:hypothetical protein